MATPEKEIFNHPRPRAGVPEVTEVRVEGGDAASGSVVNLTMVSL
jgi:hypothetical protein